MPTPTTYDGQILGLYNDANFRYFANRVVTDLFTSKEIDPPPGYVDALVDAMLDQFAGLDIPWAGEPVAAWIYNYIGEPYPGSIPTGKPPIYSDLLPPVETGGTITIEPGRETGGTEVPPTTTTAPPRFPPPITIVPPTTSAPRTPTVPPERQPPTVPAVPPLPQVPITRALPPVAPPQPSGLSPDDRKKIDDAVKELEAARDEAVKKLDDIQKQLQDLADKTGANISIDFKPIVDALYDIVDRWWRLAQAFPLHTRITTEPDDEIITQDLQDNLSTAFASVNAVATQYTQAIKSTDIEIDWPVTLPGVTQ
jgi:hypothetical protein